MVQDNGNPYTYKGYAQDDIKGGALICGKTLDKQRVADFENPTKGEEINFLAHEGWEACTKLEAADRAGQWFSDGRRY